MRGLDFDPTDPRVADFAVTFRPHKPSPIPETPSNGVVSGHIVNYGDLSQPYPTHETGLADIASYLAKIADSDGF